MPKFTPNRHKKQFNIGDQILVVGYYGEEVFIDKGKSPVLTVSLVNVEYDPEQYPNHKWSVRYICIDETGQRHSIFPWEIKPLRKRGA
jgi:hypothetical protein